MSIEWKPGDVAMLWDRGGDTEIGLCYRGGTVGGDIAHQAAWRVVGGEVWSSVTDARPLVVIDPEDREQVERLAITYAAVASARLGDEYIAWENRSTGARERIAADLTAALREFANPKPSEPLGLGAVVEDEAGERWVRTAWLGDGGPWESRAGKAATFGSITAVRVLSEGVQS